MEENNKLPALLRSIAPDKITKQQIVALFNTQTVRLNYNKMLQGLQNLEVTPSTLKESYPEFKEADKFIKTITEWRKEQAKPFNEVDVLFLEVSKEILEPISAALSQKKEQVKSASAINAAEIAKARKEQARIDLITKTIGEFINKITVDITLATTDDQIVSIQKRIGAEKSRTGFYQEYIEELRTKCDNLSATINSQKEKIRELSAINAAYEKALNDNDDSKAALIREQIEGKTEELTENSIRLQEQAFNQSLEISQTVVGQPEISVTKGRVHRWMWKLEDIDLLRKKRPELTKIVPDEEAINALLKEKRDAGEFKDIEELEFNGILFYKQKYL